jgi:hypothetical protein
LQDAVAFPVVSRDGYAFCRVRRSSELGADAVFDKSGELDGLFAYCREQTANHLSMRVAPHEQDQPRGLDDRPPLQRLTVRDVKRRKVDTFVWVKLQLSVIWLWSKKILFVDK